MNFRITSEGIFLVVLLAIFFLYPSPVRTLSNWLFLWYYEINAVSNLSLSNNVEPIFINEKKLIPLTPIAYPPQTAYGTVLARSPVSFVGDISTPQYVFSHIGLPVGVIKVSSKHINVINLFSSNLIKETYSVNDVLVEGVGHGAASFTFDIPIESEIKIGDEVIHLQTGLPAGSVVTITEIKEKNIARVVAVLLINPLHTIAYFVYSENFEKIEDTEIKQIIENLNEIEVENEITI